jgi:hypothetical protein
MTRSAWPLLVAASICALRGACLGAEEKPVIVLVQNESRQDLWITVASGSTHRDFCIVGAGSYLMSDTFPGRTGQALTVTWAPDDAKRMPTRQGPVSMPAPPPGPMRTATLILPAPTAGLWTLTCLADGTWSATAPAVMPPHGSTTPATAASP